VRSEEFEFDLGDEKVQVRAENVPIQKCDLCGEVLSGPAAAKVRHDAICRAAGFLTPSEYKAIRDGFRWSQQHMADVIGISVATIGRVEQGRLLPSRIFNNALLLMRDRPSSRAYLEERLASRRAEAGPDPASGKVASAAGGGDGPKPGAGDGGKVGAWRFALIVGLEPCLQVA